MKAKTNQISTTNIEKYIVLMFLIVDKPVQIKYEWKLSKTTYFVGGIEKLPHEMTKVYKTVINTD